MPELFTRRPQFVAVPGIAAGLMAMAGGFACYLRWTSCAGLVRIALYVSVFVGASVFAASTVTWLVLRGKLCVRVVAHPGSGVVNLTALLLCAWMGYGFVTEHALTFGIAVLLAESFLAAALAVHLMVSMGFMSGRCGFATRFGERTPVRCGVVPRRIALAVPEGFEWPDEQMPALVDDDFAQWWSPLDAIPAVPRMRRFGACRQGRSARDRATRGRCRRRRSKHQ
jgi:NAD(P) transhydrogenase subunit beta